MIFSLVLSLALLTPALHAGERTSTDQLAREIGDVFERAQRVPTKPGEPMLRPVFAKSHGCLQGTFIVNESLPRAYRVGIFEGKTYPAWVRFSNDGPLQADSVKTARGLAIKLVGVPGKKLLKGEEDAVTQDFILQNYPVFFSDTAQDFLDFLRGKVSSETQAILDSMDKQELVDPLDGQYWTPVPYRFGERAMKYMVKPCKPSASPNPTTSPDFLRENLAEHISKANACFDFYLQLAVNEEATPLDRATVLWEAKTAPYIRAARLRIPKGQDINSTERNLRCETLSFNGWHSVAAHEPLGSLNEVRKVVYKRSADRRRLSNGVKIDEPTSISPNE